MIFYYKFLNITTLFFSKRLQREISGKNTVKIIVGNYKKGRIIFF